jgi:hypothetical protein
MSVVNATDSRVDVLRRTFADIGATHRDSYNIAPMYYLLTGRRGTSAYTTANSCVIVSNHPHLEDVVLVFPEVGAEADFSLTVDVVQHLLVASGRKVHLARYAADDLERLQKACINGAPGLKLKVVPERVLDWKYPVRVLDTERVASLAGGKSYVKVRNKIRRAEEAMSETHLQDIDGLRAMRAVLRFWEGTMILNNKDTDDMSEFYLELFRVLEENPGSIDGLFFTKHRRPVGFSVWEKLPGGTANLYVNLCDTSVTGLSDYQVWRSCQHLAASGYGAMNMGGSEISSLDSFKEKFIPLESIPLLTVEVTGSAPRFAQASSPQRFVVIEPSRTPSA